MKKLFLTTIASLGMAFSAPALAQEEPPTAPNADAGAKDLEAFTKMFQNMFEKDETPIEPALLSKGERVAAAVVPKGSYRKIMAETFKKVVEPMMEGMDQIPLSTIATFAGVDEDEITLKEGANLADMMAIIDPYYKQRNRAMMTKLSDIMIDLSDDIEPSIRKGMAKAYARRFSVDELESVAQFFETKSGAKFAGESLAIFASPEVMSASMEMMPQFMERFFGAMEEITTGSGDIPPPRKLEDLSDVERNTLSELIGVDPDNMTGSATDDFAELAEEMAEDMDDEAAWNQRENWTAADRAAVEKAEAQYDAAFDTFFDAEEKAKKNAKTRLKKD